MTNTKLPKVTNIFSKLTYCGLKDSFKNKQTKNWTTAITKNENSTEGQLGDTLIKMWKNILKNKKTLGIL